MFEQFTSEIEQSAAAERASGPWGEPYLMRVDGYPEFSRRFAGATFEQGLYRVVDAATGPMMAALLREAFPDFTTRAHPFAYDWLGRQFTVDSQRQDGGQALLLLFEPGTGEALEIPLSFVAFQEGLGTLREPALASSFFEDWRRANPDSLSLGVLQCVGYKVPLFLGGKDVLSNLELIDLDVYWSLTGQLRLGTLKIPPGTSVRQIEEERRRP